MTPQASAHVDREKIVATLTRAFDRDPVLNWVVRKDEHRTRAISDFFAANYAYYARQCLVFESGEHAGASLWAPPGKWQMSFVYEASLLPTIIRIVSLRRIPLALRAMDSLKAAHPREPHYYLCAIGVVPEERGRGHASALIRAGLEPRDAAGLPAYLESSNPDNLPIYRRHGFEIMSELTLGDGAPPLHRMWRASRTTGTPRPAPR